MNETFLNILIISPIIITIVILFAFRGKGPSTVEEGSHHDH